MKADPNAWAWRTAAVGSILSALMLLWVGLSQAGELGRQDYQIERLQYELDTRPTVGTDTVRAWVIVPRCPDTTPQS